MLQFLLNSVYELRLQNVFSTLARMQELSFFDLFRAHHLS